MDMTAFGKFVREHAQDDTTTLILGRRKWEGIVDLDLAVSTIESRRKLRKKLPLWYANEDLHFPLPLSAEQCSSEETARYKAAIAARFMSGDNTEVGITIHPFRRDDNDGDVEKSMRDDNKALSFKDPSAKPRDDNEARGGCGIIMDITGGLGVDAFAFSKIAERVIYNEMQTILAEATKHNFEILGAGNIDVFNTEIGTSTDIESSKYTIRDLAAKAGITKADLIFLDPHRRSNTGSKVFMLKDCSPNAPQLLDDMFKLSPTVMVKLSPMADISLIVKQLRNVREVHVVAADGECKEVLIVMQRDWTEDYTITAYENGHSFTFSRSDEENAAAGFTDGFTQGNYLFACRRISGEELDSNSASESPQKNGTDEPQLYLFEPGKALMKAGCFKLLCSRFPGLRKTGASTHLYIIDAASLASLSQTNSATLLGMGKLFRIIEHSPLDKRSMKAFGQKYPRANVSAKNIPLTSELLQTKMRISDGGEMRIFGLKIKMF